MSDLYTLKGKYLPGESIRLGFYLDSPDASVEWTIWHLQDLVVKGSISVSPGDQVIELPALEEGGYGVDLVWEREGVREKLSTAVNVGGSTVRYGFLCDFTSLPEAAAGAANEALPGEGGNDPLPAEKNDESVSILARYHITHVQFYDWSWRPDTYLSPSEEYEDMMGKRNSLPVIRDRIAACHRRGMYAMAYGAVYAASQVFWREHPDWGFYGSDGRPMTFIDRFYYMNPDSPWRDHLMRQYAMSIRLLGFDGIHMDTYGEPKLALTVDGAVCDLEESLPRLLQDTDRTLREHNLSPRLIFNNVGTWPVRKTRDSPQDAVYMELWPPMDRYHHLREAAVSGGDHPIVLAAYPAPFRVDTPDRALRGQRFLSFAIALHGATQLFLGESHAVVTQGYYVDYTPLSEDQREVIQRYEDFFVRYGDLFYDRTLRNVSRTHAGGDNEEYALNQPFSVDGEAEKIWLVIRENARRKLIGLINLRGNSDNYWNRGKEPPTPQKNLRLTVLTQREPGSVWYASPDIDHGTPRKLSFTTAAVNLGLKCAIELPTLIYAGILWINDTKS